MADKAALKAARTSNEAFRRWQTTGYRRRIDLSNADLRKCDLRWTNFAGVNLQGADLSEAILTGCYFGPATFDIDEPHVSTKDVPVNLQDVSFTRAVLLAATFNYPQLNGAGFDNAYLGLANFRCGVFHENSFREAEMVNTAFVGCDLSGASQLETVKHYGPTHLDIETLVKSGKIPPTFLQQIGIPEVIVQYLPDLAASIKPISFYSCFISHSSADREFCDLLYSRMIREGLRVWYAPEDMCPGEQLIPQITRAIQYHDKVIIVLSDNSMQSEWVANEIRWSGPSLGRALFPISLVPYQELKSWVFVDPDSGLDIASKIRSYYVPDFSTWHDPPSFEKTFQKLLEGLRTKSRDT